MVIDSSALVAILCNEPERASFDALIELDSRRLISTVSLLEASMVMESRSGYRGSDALDLFVERARIELMPFDAHQLRIARTAFRTYGKGRHPAGLNFGDCVSYALAIWTGEPLLYKGADFRATDVPSVT